MEKLDLLKEIERLRRALMFIACWSIDRTAQDVANRALMHGYDPNEKFKVLFP